MNAVNRQSFVDAVLKTKSVESMGFDKKDYDRIVADQVTPPERPSAASPPGGRRQRPGEAGSAASAGFGRWLA